MSGEDLHDLMTKNIPPHSLEAERAVLGAMLLDRDSLSKALDMLKASDFYKEGHRRIFEAMLALFERNEPVDLLTVSEELKHHGALAEVGGPAALAGLVDEGATAANLLTYAAMVRDASVNRQLIELSSTIASGAYNGHPLTALLQTATAKIAGLSSRVAPVGLQAFAEGAGQLVARAFPSVEVFIENILTSEGSGFIGGEEKLGKSYYALAEALSLALGITVCNRFPVPVRRRVLFIEEEDSPRRTQLRARALLRGRGRDPDDPDVQADLDQWFRIAVWTGFRLDDRGWLTRLEAELGDFPAEVVYLDVLRKLTAKDLNKADQASALFDSLDAIRRTHGCLFRVLHHFRKSQGVRLGRASQELGGSFVLGAWGEQSVFLEPVGRKGAGVSFDVQAKDAAAGTTLRLRWESEGPAHDPRWVRLHLDDPKPDQAPGEKYADQVEALLATLPAEPSPYGAGVTVKALAEAIRKSDRVVRNTLAFLIKNGRCAANPSPANKLRRYFCAAPEKGENAAQNESESLF